MSASKFPPLLIQYRRRYRLRHSHGCKLESIAHRRRSDEISIGAEKTIRRYVISTGVALSLMIGSGAVLMKESLAGVLNSARTPSSMATIYNSRPTSLQATLTGDNSRAVPRSAG